MKPTKPHVTKSSDSKAATKPGMKSASRPAIETPVEPAVELDRRGKPLPPRQRVGGIITPQ
jgi:hypothetical protein